jgi:hypothetical protein
MTTELLKRAQARPLQQLPLGAELAAQAPRPPATAASPALFARLSASRPQHPLMAFCGGSLPHTLLSSCRGLLLPCLDTHSALPLRATCREARDAVALHPWATRDAPIRGSVARWRACFPRALCANFSSYMAYLYHHNRSSPLRDEDCAHLEGLRQLDISGCTALTSAAFSHFSALRHLDMTGCDQAALGSAALVHLGRLEVLCVAECTQLAGAPFAPLQRLRNLDMSNTTLGDEALAHLPAIDTLNVIGCTHLTAAAVAVLQRVRVLRVGSMSEAFSREANRVGLGKGVSAELG